MSHEESRSQFIAGMREAADFWEANPNLPAPGYAFVGISQSSIHDADLLSIIKTVGATFEKESAYDVQFTRDFGPVKMKIIDYKSSSQLRYGQKTETATVPDYSVIHGVNCDDPECPYCTEGN